MAPAALWTPEQLEGDSVSKKDLVTFLHDNATYEFLKERKLYGKTANIIKSSKKPDLVKSYKALYEAGDAAFRPEGQTLEEAAAIATAGQTSDKSEKVVEQPKDTEVVQKEPKYTKVVLKKGDGERKAKKGDTVHVFYTGTLPDGTVFDTNLGKKKPSALRFKGIPFFHIRDVRHDVLFVLLHVSDAVISFPVGVGRVIRGWDEGLMTMFKGEKARLIIESEWAYGKKGTPDGRIPPNTDLTFEVELVSID
ncbi:peptidyl-prolyl cis-trans isomerase FKBP3-like protein [Powellomyces hirtus]|nr:peptidyl-prolyl cis-trans isomerase FKBP3-like protein [Powellomyces hirtus]